MEIRKKLLEVAENPRANSLAEVSVGYHPLYRKISDFGYHLEFCRVVDSGGMLGGRIA